MIIKYASAKYTIHPEKPPLCVCRRDLIFHEHRHPKKHSRILAVTATCQNELEAFCTIDEDWTLPAEHKPDSFGYLPDGRLVAVDYGS